jgi:hypothetical protein
MRREEAMPLALEAAHTFLECVSLEVFPPQQTAGLFGVSCYTDEGSDVLAVWQLAERKDPLSDQVLAEAILDARVSTLFEARMALAMQAIAHCTCVVSVSSLWPAYRRRFLRWRWQDQKLLKPCPT